MRKIHLHMRFKRMEISELAILVLVAADEQQQFSHLSPDEGRQLSHHVFAQAGEPRLENTIRHRITIYLKKG